MPAPLPLIGLPCDRRMLSPHPFHMVGEKYLTAVLHAAGGLPLMIPALDDLDLDALLARLDGVVIPGSPSNVEPHHYQGPPAWEGCPADPERDRLTLRLIPRLVERGIPLLGICRGLQEINVALGGSLHQKVHETPGMMDHRENPADPVERQYGPSHIVHCTPGGRLAALTGQDTLTVNSVHGQGIQRLAPGLVVEAVAEDGLIEAVSLQGAPGFVMGTQFHPEWQVRDNPHYLAIFRAFGDACREHAARR